MGGEYAKITTLIMLQDITIKPLPGIAAAELRQAVLQDLCSLCINNN